MRTIPLAAAALLLCGAPAANAQDPATFFQDNCAMCHPIGGSPAGAPNLEGVTRRRDHTWLVRFLLDPEKMARTDPTAAALVKQYDGTVMPAVEGVTPALADELLRYLDHSAPLPGPAAGERRATAADVAAGREWFQGQRTLAQHGPPCVSCHRIESIRHLGGGSLGPDLTHVHKRLGGVPALNKWLVNPPTRVMRAVFRAQPLTGEEAFAISALLADESSKQAAVPGRAPTGRFALAGAGGAAAALLAMGLVWSRRLTRVRRPMVDAARQPPGQPR